MIARANLDPDVQRRHNLRNLLQTIILIVGTAALASAIAWVTFGPSGLIWAAAFGAIGIWFLGRASPRMVLRLYKARELADDEVPELHDLMRTLAKRADLQAVPRLYYVPSQMLNAFAVGNSADSAVAVTDGLLRIMNLRQLAGIMAHEVSHIRNGDLRVMGLADVLNRITGFMSTLGLLGIPLLLGTGWDIPIAGLLLLIFAPTIGGLLQLALSRAREYDADLDGATLTGDPEGLASALALLERKQGGAWEGLILPGSRLPEPSILRTHPKTADRIERLLAVRHEATMAIPLAETRTAPTPSLVPPVRPPRIHWQRLGIWY
ncbi:MAG: zinc metalloprotease HtpX [Alphaproteobacteria bacterium]|nr:zinc metalloprotease HtpX [Alphaproteobacteria bacterium]